MDTRAFPNDPIAGAPLTIWWREPVGFQGSTMILAWHDYQVALDVVDVHDRSATIATLPSRTGYDLQLQLFQISECRTSSGATTEVLGPPVIRNYRMAPSGELTDADLTIHYAPSRIGWGRSFTIIGSGFLDTLEAAKAEGADDATPVVTASYTYHCGTESGTTTERVALIAGTTNQLQLVTPDAPCEAPSPAAAHFEIRSFRGEVASFEALIDEPSPRVRGVGRP